MDLPSKILEEKAFNTEPEKQKHLFIVMDGSTHEEHLSQPVQTKKDPKLVSPIYLVIMVYSMSQTKIINWYSSQYLNGLKTT